MYYERFLWYGHPKNLARLLNEKRKLCVLEQNFRTNRLVFLDFPSTVHTNFYGVICTAIPRVCITSVFCDMVMRITYPAFEWERETKCVSTEFYSESIGVFGFSIYRAHKSVLTIGAVIIFVRSKTKWHSIVSWRCFSVINLFLKKIYYRHLLWKGSEFYGDSTGVFGFSIYRAHKSVLTIGGSIIFVRSKT